MRYPRGKGARIPPQLRCAAARFASQGAISGCRLDCCWFGCRGASRRPPRSHPPFTATSLELHLSLPRPHLVLPPFAPHPPTHTHHQARTHGTAQLTGPSGAPGGAFDEATLMRVIAHRPERTGSKLLKTLYKLSKRIK